jgi:peptide/nickel transport system permease protein
MTAILSPVPDAVPAQLHEAAGPPSLFAEIGRVLRTGPVLVSALFLLLVVVCAFAAPLLSGHDPIGMDPLNRLKPPGAEFWLGTDAFGRDIATRIIYGARTSMIVGLGTVVASLSVGLVLGLIAGWSRLGDAIIMRLMDGVMAIPPILLAIALVSVAGSTLFTVMVAVTIPEIPRVVRLVRSVILTVRTEPYVEAAVSLGTPLPRMFVRHLLPNTVAPLIVQGTFIFAAAILTEAMLSFLGAGVPPETPSWGNIMADGRMYFQMVSGMILYPGIVLSLSVLSINILGDAMRDVLDPKMAGKL